MDIITGEIFAIGSLVSMSDHKQSICVRISKLEKYKGGWKPTMTFCPHVKRCWDNKYWYGCKLDEELSCTLNQDGSVSTWYCPLTVSCKKVSYV